jgi:hypothetical protein
MNSNENSRYADKKATKFIELANKRVNKAIKDVRLIANLGNRTNYYFTDEQAARIIKALQKEVDFVKDRFKNSSEEPSEKFTL